MGCCASGNQRYLWKVEWNVTQALSDLTKLALLLYRFPFLEIADHHVSQGSRFQRNASSKSITRWLALPTQTLNPSLKYQGESLLRHIQKLKWDIPANTFLDCTSDARDIKLSRVAGRVAKITCLVCRCARQSDPQPSLCIARCAWRCSGPVGGSAHPSNPS